MTVEALTLDEYRELAAAWCDYATNGAHGRTVDDPVYRWVTEGRDPGPKYSSCGDLAHWLLARLGCRAPWLNRAELPGGWTVGLNVSRLVYSARPVSKIPEADTVLCLGDIVVAWSKPKGTDAHVSVVCDHDPVAGVLETWDYGQGPMGAAAWSTSRKHVEAAQRTRHVRYTASGRIAYEGGKTIQCVLRLPDVLEGCPMVAPDRPVGEFLDAMGLPP